MIPHGPSDPPPLIGPLYYVPVRTHALVPDGGPAGRPGYLAAGPDGVYAADPDNGRIVVIAGRGGGGGEPRLVTNSTYLLDSAAHVAVLPNGTLVAGPANGSLVAIDGGAGEPRLLDAASVQGIDTQALAADQAGRLIVGLSNGTVRVINATTGAMLFEFGANGAGGPDVAFSNITGVAAGSDGQIVVSDQDAGRVRIYAEDGALLADAGNASSPQGGGPGQFDLPHGVAVDPDGRIFVADTGNGRIQAFDPNGTFAAAFEMPQGGGGGSEPDRLPRSVAAGHGGRLFVTGVTAGSGQAVVTELELFDPPDVRALGPDGEYGVKPHRAHSRRVRHARPGERQRRFPGARLGQLCGSRRGRVPAGQQHPDAGLRVHRRRGARVGRSLGSVT